MGSLWDARATDPPPPELERALERVRALSPEALAAALAERRETHCDHGRPRGEHCSWCYVGTAEYRRSLADAMGRVLP